MPERRALSATAAELLGILALILVVGGAIAGNREWIAGFVAFRLFLLGLVLGDVTFVVGLIGLLRTRAASGRTGRGSSQRATRASQPPTLPRRARSSSSVRACRSAPVRTPRAYSRRAVAGPTPWNASTGRPASRPGASAGVTTRSPSGLASPLAVFARNLPKETPALAVSPVAS